MNTDHVIFIAARDGRTDVPLDPTTLRARYRMPLGVGVWGEEVTATVGEGIDQLGVGIYRLAFPSANHAGTITGVVESTATGERAVQAFSIVIVPAYV